MIGNRTVLIGMGERTTPMAVEIVAKSLFAHDQADRVIAIELPHSHAFMHLDTVMSMVDAATFVLYPYFDEHLRSWTVTPGQSPSTLGVSPNPDLWLSLAGALDVDQITVFEPTRTSEPLSVSNGMTGPTIWLSPLVLSSATSAMSIPTPCCASTASKS